MSKIICEICGTQYDDSASACPICGWAAKSGAAAADNNDDLDLDFLQENAPANTEEPEAPAAAPVQRQKKSREVFDFDAVNGEAPAPSQNEQAYEDNEEDEEDEEDEEPQTNVFLVVLLVILIVALLLTSGFIFWRYYLPNHRGAETTTPTEMQTEPVSESTEESTIPSIPCTDLTLVSGMEKLTFAGQNWLLHIMALPENTTDTLVFYSADESIVTVNEEGRVTAVAEGETKIIIECGTKRIECVAIVDFTPEATETEPEVTETSAEENKSEEASVEETTPGEDSGETEETSKPAADVELKLKKTDITFSVYGVYTVLELENGLTADQVVWSSSNPNIARVTEKGEVYAMGSGFAIITVTYGDQTATCKVRCNF